MALTKRLDLECKTLHLVEDDLKQEIAHIKEDLVIHNHSLKSLDKDCEKLSLEQSRLGEAKASLCDQLEFLKKERDDLKGRYLDQVILKKLASAIEPTPSDQADLYKLAQNDFDKKLKHYEQSSEYIQIVEAEAKDKELNELILEKQNELMKLEVERKEFM